MTKQEFWRLTLREFVAMRDSIGPKEEQLAFADDVL